MTPISTALPAAQLTAEDEFFYPSVRISDGEGSSIPVNAFTRIRTQTGINAPAFAGMGVGIGPGSTTLAAASAAPGNLFCCEVTTTAGGYGDGFEPTFFCPSWGPASGWASGAVTAPGSVVGTYSVDFANSDAVDNWVDDTTGFAFFPNTDTVWVDSVRVGLTPSNGFGLFFNSDGAGGVTLEHVAWDLTTTIDRVAVPVGVVSDITKWNSFTYTIVSASAGRECLVSLTVNGTAVATDKVVGVDIPFPDAQLANAFNYGFAPIALAGGGASTFFTMYGYNGRFKPDGTEVQAFGS